MPARWRGPARQRRARRHGAAPPQGPQALTAQGHDNHGGAPRVGLQPVQGQQHVRHGARALAVQDAHGVQRGAARHAEGQPARHRGHVRAVALAVCAAAAGRGRVVGGGAGGLRVGACARRSQPATQRRRLLHPPCCRCCCCCGGGGGCCCWQQRPWAWQAHKPPPWAAFASQPGQPPAPTLVLVGGVEVGRGKGLGRAAARPAVAVPELLVAGADALPASSAMQPGEQSRRRARPPRHQAGKGGR